MVKTKIVCTLGPASENTATLRKMMLAGMDVGRLNFSHGTHAEHEKRITLIRNLNKKYRRRIRILQDLEGFRIRIGRLKGKKEVLLKKGQIILLANDKKKEGPCVIPFDYEGSLKEIKKGSLIFVDDGNITLKVKKAQKRHLETEVIVGGPLTENKGVNIPDIKLRFKELTRKDKVDLRFGIRHRVDFIAQSFVRNKKDILHIKDFLGNSLPGCAVIAKIESAEGIKNIDGILDAADGIMIARGDMGVSLPVYQVPIWQKILIKKCLKRKKFVITATQMLESMTQHLRPTRAEVSDVANAILDGSHYLMLSAETATGRYPVASVKMMNQIIKYTESHRDSH